MSKRVAAPIEIKTRRVKKSATKNIVTMAPVKKARVAANSHQLPEPIPYGEILTDVAKKQWRIGKSIGVGGFGEIYAASDIVTKSVSADAAYVVKIEPHQNGPLFTEMHFYQRAAKSEMIETWKEKRKLKFLGMPKFIAFGSHDMGSTRYRFMVIERFGEDVQKKFEQSNKLFSPKLSFTLALRIIDILEYIHGTGYVHADIKGSNLLLGFNRENEVFLVDYGLACKYASQEGTHKPFSEDPRKAHNGTIEFTSRDAHVGATSRRADLEILGYNVLQWLCGKLPWEDNLKNPEDVKRQKIAFMGNIPSLMKACFKTGAFPDAIKSFLQYVSRMNFDQEPDYNACRKLFVDGLKQLGVPNDGKLDFSTAKKSPKKRGKAKLVLEDEDDVDSENTEPETPAKQRRAGLSRPCALAQANRIKKNPLKAPPKSKSNVKQSPKKKSLNKPSSVAAVPSAIIPTPAMIEVMRLREEMLKKPVPKKVSKKSRSRSNTCSSSSDVDTPTKRPLRRTRRERASIKSSSSSDYLNRTVSPDLF